MPSAAGAALRGTSNAMLGLIFPIVIVASIAVIVLPLSPVFLDLFLACNITAAVLILLTTISVSRPLEFSVFPAVLLGTTLIRLVLNLATTRLILTRGATDKTAAAGHVIEAFGEFVAGDKLVVGVILFCILVAIQFLVITKGAGRISEVAARFFLDGMPGKQMAIDAELAAHAIDPQQAKLRREEIASQADFYGAMDGASKFVRGDAIAGIVITIINILGGLYVGVIEHGMAVGEAADVFSKLTIGDGLVTQVPAFLISLASALLVTRTSSESNLSRDVVGQLFRNPTVMFLSSGFLLLLTITGLPKLPLFSLAAGCAVVGWTLHKHALKAATEAALAAEIEDTQPTNLQPEDRLLVQPVMLELGAGLVSLANPESGGELLEQVLQVRHQIAKELGIIIPKVSVRDQSSLGLNEYVIRIRDLEVARGEVWPQMVCAINNGRATGELRRGLSFADPINGRPSYWIPHKDSDNADQQGFTILAPGALVIAHLTDVVRCHASELLTRQHAHELIGGLKTVAPKLIEEVNSERVKISHVHHVLKSLLAEQIPIRDLETILQTIVDGLEQTTNLALLTEFVRTALSRCICERYRDSSRRIQLVSLDPVLEDYLKLKLDFSPQGLTNKLSPHETESILKGLMVELKKLTDIGLVPIVLTTAPQIRSGLRLMSRRNLPKLVVLCLHEMTADTHPTARGSLSADCLRAVLTAGATG